MKKHLLFIASCIISGIIPSQTLLQWEKVLNGSAENHGGSIKTNASGEVFVAGVFTGTVDFDPGAPVYTLAAVSAKDGYLLKTDAAGNFMWATSIDAEITALAIDPTGNVFVGGYYNGVKDFDPGVAQYTLSSTASLGFEAAYVLKLDPSGNFLWARQAEGPALARVQDMTTDPSGNIYYCGRFRGTIDFDPAPAPNNSLQQSTGGITSDGFVAKLTSAGNFGWGYAFGSTIIEDEALGMVSDAAGNIFTTGVFCGSVDFAPGPSVLTLTTSLDAAFVTKINSSGNLVWARKVNSSTLFAFGTDIALDQLANVYYCGGFRGTTDFDPGAGTATLTSNGGPLDLFISKLDSAGNYTWAKGIGSTGSEQAGGLAVDATGNTWITGLYATSFDFDPASAIANLPAPAGSNDVYISKFDSGGNYIWAGAVGGPQNDAVKGICVDASGNCYVSGSFSVSCDLDPNSGIATEISAGHYDGFVLKLNASANPTITTAIADISQQASWSVYPNPARETVHIRVSKTPEHAAVEVYNSLGILVGKQDFQGNEALINIADQPKGLFFVRITVNSKVIGSCSLIRE
ncbi:MAG: T9SS type A sorting domain-containing protein [Bacteroidota bacterium]